jgi:hypothetical protein
MSGSTTAVVVIPIVVVIVLATWLAMVFYADSHPRWPTSSTTSGRGSPGLPEGAREPPEVEVPRPRQDGSRESIRIGHVSR